MKLAGLAATANPDSPEPHAIAARAHEASGKLGAALNSFMEAARRAPNTAEHWRELARIALALGQLPEACMALTQAVRCSPDHAASRLALAATLQRSNEPLQAAQQLLNYTSLSGDFVHLITAGELAWQAGKRQRALHIWRLATQRMQDNPQAWTKLARGLHSVGDRLGARDAAKRAALLSPESSEAHRLHGILAKNCGAIEEARDALASALQRDPTDPISVWARAACVPPVCSSTEHEQHVIERYDRELDDVWRLKRDHPTDPRWPSAIQTAFAVHYLQDDHSERQARHGALIEACVPTPPPWDAPRKDGDRLHVVAISAFFRNHTVHKLFTGWLRGLDRSRFRVTALATPSRTDAQTDAVRRAVDTFVQLSSKLEEAVTEIRSHAPDIILFPELGMDPHVLRIAASRLAPIQAMSWGHPIGCGLSTIDLVISSAGMEYGDDWTGCQRIDLPGVGLELDRVAPPESPLSRADLGLPSDRVLLLSVQTLAKYRAWTDDLHARIAEGAPEALLVFIEDPNPAVTDQFRERLYAACAHRNLVPDHHIRFLPRQDTNGWLSLLACGDVFLDSPGWSGGNTTIEAIAMGLPTLAFPGITMRGRHARAIVAQLGLEDHLGPDDADAWVEQAIRLATQPEYRRATKSTLTAASHKLFNDTESTQRLADALEHAWFAKQVREKTSLSE